MTDKAAILASLTASLAEHNRTIGETYGDPDTDAYDDIGDAIAGVRDYIESTQPSVTGTALAEVAYAFLAGIEHASAEPAGVRPAYAALRKAGLTL